MQEQVPFECHAEELSIDYKCLAALAAKLIDCNNRKMIFAIGLDFFFTQHHEG